MISTTVTQPALAAIRFQFWKDALSAIWTGKTMEGKPTAIPLHPVAVSLGDMRKNRPVQRYYLSQMIDARVSPPCMLFAARARGIALSLCSVRVWHIPIQSIPIPSSSDARPKYSRSHRPPQRSTPISSSTARFTLPFSSDRSRFYFPHRMRKRPISHIPYRTSPHCLRPSLC